MREDWGGGGGVRLPATLLLLERGAGGSGAAADFECALASASRSSSLSMASSVLLLLLPFTERPESTDPGCCGAGGGWAMACLPGCGECRVEPAGEDTAETMEAAPELRPCVDVTYMPRRSSVIMGLKGDPAMGFPCSVTWIIRDEEVTYAAEDGLDAAIVQV